MEEHIEHICESCQAKLIETLRSRNKGFKLKGKLPVTINVCSKCSRTKKGRPVEINIFNKPAKINIYK
jgi:hypothetical protein